jgi:LIM domain
MRFAALLLAFLCAVAGATPLFASQEEVPSCAACGKPVINEIFQTKGTTYHGNCFRCAQCDRPITGAYSEYKDKNYHNTCFERHVALKCSLCDDIIRGEYLQDFWGNSYCLRHDSDAPVCDSCGRFIAEHTTEGGVRYDDGRFVCNLCRPKSITDIDEILGLVHEVAGHMRSVCMKFDYNGIRIHLIGRDEMQKLSGHHSDGLRGFTDYREDFRVFGRSHDRRMDMYLLYGMPRMELVSTIAHELGHVWQFNRGRFRNDRAWNEGSCNYAAYLVLARYRGRESAFFRSSLSRDDNDVYGEGFRRVKALADAEGNKTWLRHLARDTDFPAGY